MLISETLKGLERLLCSAFYYLVLARPRRRGSLLSHWPRLALHLYRNVFALIAKGLGAPTNMGTRESDGTKAKGDVPGNGFHLRTECQFQTAQ